MRFSKPKAILCCFLLCLTITFISIIRTTEETQTIKDQIRNQIGSLSIKHVLPSHMLNKMLFVKEVSNKTNLIKIFGKRQLDPRNRTYILAWSGNQWDVSNQGFADGEGNDQCVITFDKTKLKHSSVVLFHHLSLRSKMWRHYRDNDQVFVFDMQEAPSVVALSQPIYLGLARFNGFFNWTMGYRTDNDIWRPYNEKGALRKSASSSKEDIDKILAKKKNIALWVVSDCSFVVGAKRRISYVEELVKAGLKVDRFGKCFNNREEFNRMSKEKLESYKFYLAFENSYHCKDYMSEKFWYNGLYSNRVPVVFGAKYEEVKRLAPPGSFIHTEEYPSVETLVEYLLYLDKNDTAYREYFNWKIPPYNRDDKMLKLIKSHERIGLDLLCDRLVNNTVYKSIRNMGEFYYKRENNGCFL